MKWDPVCQRWEMDEVKRHAKVELELGDGVQLRTVRRTDAAAVLTAIRASHAELAPWMTWLKEDHREADVLSWIDDESLGYRLVMQGDDGQILGTAGINVTDPLHEVGELGYWIRTDQTGRGLATRCTRALAAHGLTHLGLGRVELLIATSNKASRSVAERSGARHEGISHSRMLLHGTRHDAHLYAFTTPPR